MTPHSSCAGGGSRGGHCFVGLDVGTTNARAWLVAGGRVVATRRQAVGIRDAAAAGTPEVLYTPLQVLIERVRGAAVGLPAPVAVVAAGMITSDLGFKEVPHLEAPADAHDLAAGAHRMQIPAVTDLPVVLIPGVRSGASRLPPERIGEADVMRGEETLCAGLLARGIIGPGGVILNLGSHWKSIFVDEEGRIARSVTTLAGELLHAAQTRTVLAASVPDGRPTAIDEQWAHAGAEEARRSGLDRALFCVRLLEQRADGTPQQRLSFLVGCFVGLSLDRWCSEIPSGVEVVVTGGGPVGDHVAQLVGAVGRRARRLPEDAVETAMVAGLHAVAGLLPGSLGRS